jgi:hypothetical protein
MRRSYREHYHPKAETMAIEDLLERAGSTTKLVDASLLSPIHGPVGKENDRIFIGRHKPSRFCDSLTQL